VIGRDIGDALLSFCGRFAPPPTQYVLIQISEILLLAVKAGFPPCSALPRARLHKIVATMTRARHDGAALTPLTLTASIGTAGAAFSI
jgi:hypothetical protein